MSAMIPVAQFCSKAFKSLRAVLPGEVADATCGYSPVLRFASATLLSTAIGGQAPATAPPPLPDLSDVSVAADAIHEFSGRGGELLILLKSQIWIDKGLMLPQFTRCMNIFGPRSQMDIDCTKFQEAGKKDEVKDKAEKWLYDTLWGPGYSKKPLVSLPIDGHTRVVFSHAFAFLGEWADDFFACSGGHSKFYRLVGSPLRGPFLTSNAKLCVGVYDGFQVLRLPYKKDGDVRQFSMYIFLPDTQDGISELSKRMSSDPDFIVRHIPTTMMRLRDFKIPDGLRKIAFSDGNVLVWPSSDECVDSESYCSCMSMPIVYMAHNFKVEGSGVIKKRAIEVANTDFVADHPFIWAVREDITGVVLFTGHFSDLCVENNSCWM